MSAFNTVKISRTKTKWLTEGKKSRMRGPNSATKELRIVAIWSVWKRYLLCQEKFKIGWLKEEYICLQQNFFLDVRHFVCWDFLASTTCVSFWHLRVSEIYATVGSAIVCDRLRSYGNNSLCNRLRSTICDPRSSAIVCDHMETSLYPRHRKTEFEIPFSFSVFLIHWKWNSNLYFQCV